MNEIGEPTTRDIIAFVAMHAFVTSTLNSSVALTGELIANASYEVADAMIKRSNQEKPHE